jgi:hypothetical protein
LVLGRATQVFVLVFLSLLRLLGIFLSSSPGKKYGDGDGKRQKPFFVIVFVRWVLAVLPRLALNS